MKNSWFKKLIPHGLAVLVFLVVAFIYCKPVVEGKVVAQSDITHWKGSVQQSVEYSKTHDGVYPLWTNSMFGGMPTFQIGYTSNIKVPWIAHKIFSLGLPKPVNFFFLACICFYFLSTVLGIRTIFGILGSLAFAYCTYNPVIVAVGHDTKMLSIAYMPALLASLILIYEKKYWLGAGLTALFTSVLITQNHPQIAYYLFLTAAIMTIFYLVRWIKNKEWRHLGKAFAFTVVAGITGVLANATSLLSTYEYQKETIRGGGSGLVMDSTIKKDDAKNGLDKDYALSYSMNIAEPFVMMVPRMYGGSSDHEEIKQEDSKALMSISGFPSEVQQQVFSQWRTYWGGMTKAGEVGTSGPPYVGAIICILAILGFFFLDGKHKWWILAAVGITIMMSWGSYFDALNGLLYKYLPMYNKFRAPSMILVISQLLIPLLAVLALNKISETEDKKILAASFKKGLIGVGVTFATLFIIYVLSGFMSGANNQLMNDLKTSGDPQWVQVFNTFFEGLREDRKSLMMSDILRALGFGAIAVLLLWLAIRKSVSATLLGILLVVFVLIDNFTVNVKYLNYENYKVPEESNSAFIKTAKDEEILADKSVFRVYNVSGNAFFENITSYYYNSVGGYHPAKIAIYQDLVEHQLSKQQPNMAVINMLNTKYFIQKDGNGQTQNYQKNEGALGTCWLVKNIQFVKDAAAEMKALDNFNPKDTAIVQEDFKTSVPFMPEADSTAAISLVKNDNDVVTYSFNAAANQFAVFSEVYYKSGWKAYIDGKEAPIVKVNYVLRGLAVSAGKHEIKFEFKPGGYYTGKKLTSIFSIILLVILAAGIFMEWRNRNQAALANRV